MEDKLTCVVEGDARIPHSSSHDDPGIGFRGKKHSYLDLGVEDIREKLCCGALGDWIFDGPRLPVNVFAYLLLHYRRRFVNLSVTWLSGRRIAGSNRRLVSQLSAQADIRTHVAIVAFPSKYHEFGKGGIGSLLQRASNSAFSNSRWTQIHSSSAVSLATANRSRARVSAWSHHGKNAPGVNGYRLTFSGMLPKSRRTSRAPQPA